MEDLLPYFEREFVMLRRLGREFAAHYPKLAGQFHLNGDNCTAPHVERLIQANALLAARITKRLDGDDQLSGEQKGKNLVGFLVSLEDNRSSTIRLG